MLKKSWKTPEVRRNKNKSIYTKIVFFVFSFLVLQTYVFAAHKHLEKDYQTKWCNARKGIMEYKLQDKARVDCLTDTLAVEFDFAPKWAECIGQALYYGKKTKKTPACVLIMENPVKDSVYLYRLRYTVYKKRKKQPGFLFKTFTMYSEELDNFIK